MSLAGWGRFFLPEVLSRGTSGVVGPQTSHAEEKLCNPVGE